MSSSIIEKREVAGNAGNDHDAEVELRCSKQGWHAHSEGARLRHDWGTNEDGLTWVIRFGKGN